MALLTDDEIRARNACLQRERRARHQENIAYMLRGSDSAYQGLLERTEAIAREIKSDAKQQQEICGCEHYEFPESDQHN